MGQAAKELQSSGQGEYEREFIFTRADFQYVQRLIKERTGISLSAAKEDMVYARLGKRLRATGLPRFRDYCELVNRDSAELVNLINAITTNLTAFFRELHHFEHLQNRVIPALVAAKGTCRKLRIWSAGCSSGEEPYSIAMAVLEAIPDLERWDVKILASDLDSNMVEAASKGVYRMERLQGISQERLKRWMRRGTGSDEGWARAGAELRSIIQFKQLNLMDAWPMRNSFDIIFCRNVVIYFDKPTQQRLFDRYANQLDDDGWLFIGHSESLYGVTDRFELTGKTIYKRVK